VFGAGPHPPTPNPQSPIPNPQILIQLKFIKIIKNNIHIKINLIIYKFYNFINKKK